MEADELPELKTEEQVYNWLALKHANGMSLKQVLDVHTLILTRIGRDHVKTWTDPDDYPGTSTMRLTQHHLINGAYYILDHLEDYEERYRA